MTEGCDWINEALSIDVDRLKKIVAPLGIIGRTQRFRPSRKVASLSRLMNKSSFAISIDE